MALAWLKKFAPRVHPFGDVGQTFFVVTSTANAEWDTGLADLYNTTYRGPSGRRVFHTRDYASHQAAINAARAATVASRGDIVFLTPGTYNIAGSITASKAGVRYMGPPVKHPRRAAVVLDGNGGGVAGDVITFTAADNELSHVKVIPNSGYIGASFSAAANRLYVHHVYFDLMTPAISANTRGLVATGAAADLLIEDCDWQSDGAQGSGLVTAGVIDGRMGNCRFRVRQNPDTTGTWASPWDVGAATVGFIATACTFMTASGGTMTAAVDGVSANRLGAAHLVDCRFQGELGSVPIIPVDNFDPSECTLVECYKSSAGGAIGGTLITAIT